MGAVRAANIPPLTCVCTCVSDQVVLLTTDAELDETLLDAVRPRLARTYRLTFDTQRGETFPSVSPPHEVVPAAVPMSR